MDWLSWLILGIIAAVFAAIVVKGILNKKKGKGGCSCGCANCAMKDSCHSSANK